MADMTLCDNYLCQIKDECLRYTTEPNKKSQSYLLEPKQDCEEEGWKFYIDNE